MDEATYVTIHVEDSEGNVIYSTLIDLVKGKEGGFVRWLNSELDENWSHEGE